jgi:predicted esterase
LEPSHHSLEVKRSAQLYTLGRLNAQTQYVWVVLHGYAQHPRYWIAKFEALAQHPHTAVVAPEGLSKFYVAGQSGRVGASWMTSDHRQQEIADYLGYLETVRAWVVAQAPQAQLVLLGFSQGGATAARVAAAAPAHWPTLVLWCAIFPPDMPATLPQPLQGYLVYGQADPYLQAEHLQLLQQTDAWPHFERLAFAGGHEVVGEVLERLQQRVVRG